MQAEFNPKIDPAKQPERAAALASVNDFYARRDAAARLEVEAAAGSTVGALEKMFNSPPNSTGEHEHD